jgi:hypothetical protein
MSNSLRDAPPLSWPALRRPDGGGKLVYLDQKHWVHLAQADTGHPGGTCYAAALQAARAARAAGTAIFPLSVVHYSETLRGLFRSAGFITNEPCAARLRERRPAYREDLVTSSFHRKQAARHVSYHRAHQS